MEKSVKMMLKGGMIALLLFFGLTASQNARAQTGVTLSFDPAEIVATTCGTQTVEVWVEDVVDLTGYHLEISFDPGVIEVTDVVNGGFLAPPGESALYEPTNSIDNVNGLITFGLVQQGDGTGDPNPKTGDGVLIEITLRAVVPNETSAITIDADNSILVDWPEVSPIDFTTSDGSVTTESCQPTGMGIIDNWIPENEQVGTEVGIFYTIDPDLPNDFFTYELVPGAGDVDNDSFEIVGSSLKTKEVFNYEEQMIYRIRVRSTDWGGKTFEKAFLIFVLDVNDPPAAQDQSVETPEDTALPITLMASDVDGDALTYAIVAEPAHGNVTLDGKIATYTPAANFHGTDSFTFKANDGTVDSNVATVTITVTAVNDAPVAQDKSVTTPEDTALPITLVATDVDGDTLTYAIVAQPAHGSVTLDGKIATYTPAANFHGSDSFTFKANDGTVDSNTATVTITVTAVNDAPVAQDKSVTTPEDTALPITLVATDVDGDTLTYAIVAEPAHGSVTLDGKIATYTPAANFNGEDSFTYKAKDAALESELAVVTITVTPVNDWVEANDDAYETTAGVTLDVAAPGVLENDVLLDPDETVSLEVIVQPAGGMVTLNDDGSFTYAPNAGFFGVDTFEYQLNSTVMLNNGEFSDTAVVTIVVKPYMSLYLPLILR